MPPDKLIFIYTFGVLLALCLVVIYSEIRRRRFRPERNEDRIFRCHRCGFVYTDDSDVDRSRCSQCGQINDAFEF